MAAIVVGTEGRDPMFWLVHGAIGGLIAGVVSILFQLSAALLSSGPGGALGPLRMIAAIVLGRAALDPSYSAVAACLAGMIVHLCLAATFGLLFGALLLTAVQIDIVLSGRTTVIAGCAYGLVLWLINFYSVASLAGLSWFADASSPLVQFAAHTLCYGAVLGLHFQRKITLRARTVGRAARPSARPHPMRRAG
jgi:hypothetical protein